MSDEHQSATETLMYSFDYPMLTESGLIKICDKRICFYSFQKNLQSMSKIL